MSKLDSARERIADLEHCLAQHLTYMGPCDDAQADDGESMCTSPECTYCELARTLQPTACGRPLNPRSEDPAP